MRAHRVLMGELIRDAGVFRNRNVGVYAGDRLIHAGTPSSYVPELVGDLFDWLKNTEAHPLIASCVFHYEFEFIHPFTDGNGRTGRFWHTLILSKWKPFFAWMPVETLVYRHQQAYYEAINRSTNESNCACFIELMLDLISETLREYARSTDQETDRETDQVQKSENAFVNKLLSVLGNETLSATELMKRLGLSHRPTFRQNYLTPALEQNLIERTIPDQPNNRNQKYRKKHK